MTGRTWRMLGATAIVLALLVTGTSWGAPVRAAAGDVAAQVKQALKLGHRADRRATQALRTARAARQAAGPGPAGPAGPTGPEGPEGIRGRAGAQGSGLGYAQIEYCPVPTGCEDFPQLGWFSSDDTNSPGIDNTVNFTSPPPADGVFCYHDLPFTAHVVLGTIGTVGDATAASIPYLVQGRAGSAEHPLTECGFPVGTDPAHTAAVFVRDMTGALAEPAHDLRVFVLFG